jgi:hypothetical protein
MAAVAEGLAGPEVQIIRPEPGSCGFYVQRKKRWAKASWLGSCTPPTTRFCKMNIKPGAQYCGEHSPLPATEHDLGGWRRDGTQETVEHVLSIIQATSRSLS